MKNIIDIKLLYCVLFLFVIISQSCQNNSNQKKTVDFNDIKSKETKYEKENEAPIYIAIASMTSPRETFTYYNQLVEYLSDKLGKPILIRQKRTYSEVNELLKSGKVDFAFICSGAYIDLSQEKDISLLVAPVINDKTYYQAYIISKKSPSINEFKDLKNKSFAFTDPLSNTGHVYPEKLLKELGTNKKSFFTKTLFTYGHDVSINLVNRNVIDGASVHGLIFDYISENNPKNISNIKILKKSEWFGMPPIVTPKQLDKESYLKYKQLFLNIHKDSIGRSIIKKLKIDKFVTMEDSTYDNVRKLKNYVEN